MSMDSGLKQRWIEALRSGEYRQGQDRLRTEHNGAASYCCLGVLCDLLVKDGKGTWERDVAGRYYFQANENRLTGIEENTSVLPASALRLTGIESPNPFVTFDRKTAESRSSLAYLNDHGASFDRIAGIIEESDL